jgi:DNA-binding MarR family transcriptional regulator
MTTKWDVVAALKKSGLLSSDRIIMMMLVDVADAETAYVAEQWSPSLTELARWTGLGRSTVAARLDELERLGWVKRERPPTAEAIARGARTCYHLTIGETVEKAKPSRPANPTRTSPAAGPVQASDQVTAGSPDAGLVQPLDEGSPAAGLPLVRWTQEPPSYGGWFTHQFPPRAHHSTVDGCRRRGDPGEAEANEATRTAPRRRRTALRRTRRPPRPPRLQAPRSHRRLAQRRPAPHRRRRDRPEHRAGGPGLVPSRRLLEGQHPRHPEVPQAVRHAPLAHGIRPRPPPHRLPRPTEPRHRRLPEGLLTDEHALRRQRCRRPARRPLP